MKRADLESKACDFLCQLKSRIESAPLQSVIVALVVGILIAAIPFLAIFLIVMAVAVAGVSWLFAETDTLANDAAAANAEKSNSAESLKKPGEM